MNVALVVGARPQFIKAAPVSRALRQGSHAVTLIHTGQHYDYAMSQVFFDELDVSPPHVNLSVGSGSHARQTAEMLWRIEEVLEAERPDVVVVFGDTNSTLAGALATCKLRLPLAHVEAGLRSFNRAMPEEHNRVLTDHCADMLFCPTGTAVFNLAREGVTQGVHLVGDTMLDAVRHFLPVARRRSTVLRDLGLSPDRYALLTIHRAYNTDDAGALEAILSAVSELEETIVFPVHPRTRKQLEQFNLWPMPAHSRLKLIDPVGYTDMLILEQHARLIVTDSGGMQKEAYFLGVPCVTVRPETEWVETLEGGWNVVAGTTREGVLRAVTSANRPDGPAPPLFGTGDAAQRIVRILESAVAGVGRDQGADDGAELAPIHGTHG
jgi:UDP-N-acetylglucosamine 2-epimerase